MKNKYLVYMGHGIGRVTGIHKKQILGATTEFISIEILETGMKIYIPKGMSALVTRDIMNKATMKKCMEILNAETKPVSDSAWNKRYREYMETIKTGNPIQVATVIKDLSDRKIATELSFGERKMLDFARAMLEREIEIVRGLGVA